MATKESEQRLCTRTSSAETLTENEPRTNAVWVPVVAPVRHRMSTTTDADMTIRPCVTSTTPSSSAMPTGGATSATGSAASTETNRSIVVDTSFFEEQFLRCQVCQERFHDKDRPPKSLPCNHTFCLTCLTQIFTHAQPASRRNPMWANEPLEGPLKCPTCRVEVFLNKHKIKDLPNDHRVIQMIDFLSQAVSAAPKNVCTKHERQPLNFFCKKCLLPVCRDCTVLDHKETQGHHIVDVKEALTDRSGDFNQVEQLCRQMLEKMKARSDALANASKRLDIQERQLKNEIKETFIEYRLLLEKRQEALTHILQQNIRDQKALINTRFTNVCDHGTQLQKLYDAFGKAKESSDVEQLFNLHKQIKDSEAQFSTVASGQDHELFRSCDFEAECEAVFLSGISSLGEVTTKDDPALKEPVSAHQLFYLDNEIRQESERLLQFQASLAEAQHMYNHHDFHNQSDFDTDEQDVDEPEIDMEDSYSRYMMERDEDVAVQRINTRSMYRRSMDVMDQDTPHPFILGQDTPHPVILGPSPPRTRPRSGLSPARPRNLLEILSRQQQQQQQQQPTSSSSSSSRESHGRSGSRSRRTNSSREGGSRSGSEYLVQRSGHQ